MIIKLPKTRDVDKILKAKTEKNNTFSTGKGT